jgi:hypothetical protein
MSSTSTRLTVCVVGLMAAVGSPRASEAAPSAKAAAPSTRSARNAVFAEAGGAGLLYSVNYERHVTADLAFRVGYGYFSYAALCLSDCSRPEVVERHTVPLVVSWTLGRRGPHHVNLSGGVSPTFFHTTSPTGDFIESRWAVTPMAEIGYRLQPRRGGVYFRIGLAGVLLDLEDGNHLPVPLPSLALGGTF